MWSLVQLPVQWSLGVKRWYILSHTTLPVTNTHWTCDTRSPPSPPLPLTRCRVYSRGGATRGQLWRQQSRGAAGPLWEWRHYWERWTVRAASAASAVTTHWERVCGVCSLGRGDQSGGRGHGAWVVLDMCPSQHYTTECRSPPQLETVSPSAAAHLWLRTLAASANWQRPHLDRHWLRTALDHPHCVFILLLHSLTNSTKNLQEEIKNKKTCRKRSVWHVRGVVLWLWNTAGY